MGKKLSTEEKEKREAEYEKNYKAYQKYIRSKEFQAIATQVFARDGNKCACCGWSPDDYDPEKKSTKRSLSCHHRTYEHLYNEPEHMGDLVTLCNVCHLAIHRAPSNFSRFGKSNIPAR